VSTFDADESNFTERVIERSREVPVVVDFWADWCGPCKALSPALVKAANAREGLVDLAKVDVDRNQRLAAAFRVQGIPAVKAFRDGKVADEFTGAIPPAQVEAFFDRLVPSQAELDAANALEAGDEEELRRALAADPKSAPVAAALGRILIQRGDYEDAAELLEPLESDFVASGLAARARLQAEGEPDLSHAFSAWDSGDLAGTLERLQDALAGAGDTEARDRIRRVMVAIFTELGPDDPLAREHRRRLSAALN
jgi:putative thioredoxin